MHDCTYLTVLKYLTHTRLYRKMLCLLNVAFCVFCIKYYNMSELIEAYETSGTYIRSLNKKDMLFLSQDSFTSSSDPDSCTIMGYKSEYLGQGGLFISVNKART